MNIVRQRAEVDANYDAFQRMLPDLLGEHAGRFALMRDQQVIDIFEKVGEANRAGMTRFDDGIFSIQEVTDEPIDLGFYSHVAA